MSFVIGFEGRRIESNTSSSYFGCADRAVDLVDDNDRLRPSASALPVTNSGLRHRASSNCRPAGSRRRPSRGCCLHWPSARGSGVDDVDATGPDSWPSHSIEVGCCDGDAAFSRSLESTRVLRRVIVAERAGLAEELVNQVVLPWQRAMIAILRSGSGARHQKGFETAGGSARLWERRLVAPQHARL
jgi:hypothetical protein